MAKLTKPGVVKALMEFHGNISAAARSLSVTRCAIRKYIDADAELKQAVIDAREAMKDDAESVIALALADYKNDPRLAFEAARTVMIYTGKDRGWSSGAKVEVSGADGGPIGVKHHAGEDVLKALTELNEAIAAGADQAASEKGLPADDSGKPVHPG